jgi:hypothetical protein
VTHFTAETYQNEFLPLGGTEVNAVVTVTGTGGGGEGGGEPGVAAEIIIVDASTSMSFPSAKIKAARQATGAALDALRDGTQFAIIAGSQRADEVYPGKRALAEASARTRSEAKDAIDRYRPRGSTAIGTWLTLAAQLFAESRAGLRHAILLTDGQNSNETEAQLTETLRGCQGQFQCDCRGVGTDWEVAELRRIASALLGTVDIIAEPSQMEADFRALAEGAMARGTANVALRLWTPKGSEVAFVKQVAPSIQNLTDRPVAVDALTSDYPTGAWGDETRDYHVCIRVPAREAGDEVLAGRVSLVVDGEVQSQALIRAVWTDDEQLSTRINREVAHYTGQTELAEAIQEGLGARRAGDQAEATLKLGRAVQLAAASGNTATMRLLASVVDVGDAATGAVQLRQRVTAVDEMSLDTRSTKTVRVHRG